MKNYKKEVPVGRVLNACGENYSREGHEGIFIICVNPCNLWTGLLFSFFLRIPSRVFAVYKKDL
jgi:hypothetical protein